MTYSLAQPAEFGMSLFGALDALRSRSIGDQTALRAAKTGFRKIAIERSNAHFAEGLVEARSLGLAGENYYWSERNPPYWRRIDGAVPDLLLRKTVGDKLARINARLKAAGLELFLFDAWRPKAVQAYFHDVWMPAEIRRRHPALSGAALTAEVERYWAAPSGDENSPRRMPPVRRSISRCAGSAASSSGWVRSSTTRRRWRIAIDSKPWPMMRCRSPTRKRAPTGACCIG